MNPRTRALASVVLALASSALSCGNAELIVAESLRVLDTHPSNGALVPVGTSTVVVAFSEPVVPESLLNAVDLAQTTSTGRALRDLPLEFRHHAEERDIATYGAPPFAARSHFRMTVRADIVRAKSGARLHSDFVREFRTADE